jgi:hypothetical protein
MVDLTRRKTVIGLGLLATGSGATFTSAAFQSSTQPDSDLRVVVDQNLQFGANPDLNPDERDDIADDPGFFDDDGSSSGELNESDGVFDEGNETDGFDDDGDGGFDPDGDSDEDSSSGFDQGFEPGLPKAFAEGANDELTIKAAVQIGNEKNFNDLLRVGNATEEIVRVGIAYDRTGLGDGDNGNYGADVEGGQASGELSVRQAQKIYQFHTSDDASDNLISPSPGEGGEDGEYNGGSPVSIPNDTDQPNALVELAPGESVDLDLVVNTTDQSGISRGAGSDADVENDILTAADIDEGAFGFQTDTVQIMEVIRVVSEPVPDDQQ